MNHTPAEKPPRKLFIAMRNEMMLAEPNVGVVKVQEKDQSHQSDVEIA